MIKRVAIINDLKEMLILTLGDIESRSGLFITSIDGLGPVKSTINMTELATQDGSRYNSARSPYRNIVINLRHIGFDPEESRQITYRYFPLKGHVIFEIETDHRHVYIDGYVESNEPDIFSPAESSTISILCPQPWFYSGWIEGKDVINAIPYFTVVDETAIFHYDTPPTTGRYVDNGDILVEFGNTTPKFEFPVSFELGEGVEFSVYEDSKEGNVYYEGDVETGITMYIDAYGEFTNPTIYNRSTRESLSIDTSKIPDGILYGDRIIINTVKGNKTITLLRNGLETNIINALDKDADWFTLRSGDNVFAYVADTGVNNMYFSIMHRRLYGGI